MPISDTSSQDTELQPKRKLWLYVLLGGLAVILIGFASLLYPVLERWSGSERSVSAERIRIATVTRGDLVRDIPVQARVVAGVSPTLYATQQGIVDFQVEIGETVVKDQVLAHIENDVLINELSQAKASLAQLESDIERLEIQSRQQVFENQRNIDLAQVAATATQREAKRAELSYEQQAISDLDYQKRKDELQSAEFALEYAKNFAVLDKERIEFEQRAQNLAYEQQQLKVSESERQVLGLDIRSPIQGIVGSLLVEQKTFVNPGNGILTVVDLTQFELESEVPEPYAPELFPGIEVEVRTNQGVILGSLISVAPEVINNQVQVRMRFKEQPSQSLRQNQRLSARIILENKENVLTLPRGTFLDTGGGLIAYVVENGLATRRSVEFGARSTNAVEILGGVNEGDQIVVSGTELFRGANSIYISN